MPDFDFPNSPTTNQVYTANGVSWRWNGVYWVKFSLVLVLRDLKGIKEMMELREHKGFKDTRV